MQVIIKVWHVESVIFFLVIQLYFGVISNVMIQFLYKLFQNFE